MTPAEREAYLKEFEEADRTGTPKKGSLIERCEYREFTSFSSGINFLLIGILVSSDCARKQKDGGPTCTRGERQAGNEEMIGIAQHSRIQYINQGEFT